MFVEKQISSTSMLSQQYECDNLKG